MINMMKADLYRMTKSRGMWIFCAAVFFTYLLSIAFKEAGGVNLGIGAMIGAEGIKMDIEQVGMNFTFYFLLIIPVFCIITADFSENTIKNTLTSAISRKTYFCTKFIFTELFNCISFFVCNILFYIVNRIVNGEEYYSACWDYTKAVLIQLPVMVGVTAVFVLLAFLFNKAALFNSITILTPILYTTAALVFYGVESTRKFAENYLLKYELTGMLSYLALGCTDDYRNNCMLICACALVVSFVLGYLVFTKREVK